MEGCSQVTLPSTPQGIGTRKIPSQAFYWLQKAARQKHSTAMFDLALEYMKIYKESGSPSDDEEALFWLTMSSQRKNTSAQLALGLMYLTGSGVPQSIKRAIHHLHTNADSVHAPSQFLLSALYKTGAWGQMDKDEEQGNYYMEEAMREGRFHKFFNFNLQDFLFVRWVNSEKILKPLDPMYLMSMAKNIGSQ